MTLHGIFDTVGGKWWNYIDTDIQYSIEKDNIDTAWYIWYSWWEVVELYRYRYTVQYSIEKDNLDTVWYIWYSWWEVVEFLPSVSTEDLP